MELKVTRYEIDDEGVVTVWLHRLGRGHSWSGRMNAELRWVMATLDNDRPCELWSFGSDGSHRSLLAELVCSAGDEGWEAIEQQNELLRAMRAAPPGSPPEDSMGDIIQKAANAITVKDYPRVQEVASVSW